MVTAIHVDDDRRSIDVFKAAANEIPRLALKASFTNTDDALYYLVNNKIDILFSDIEMPNRNGFWLAEQMIQQKLNIVFVTAHAGYAVNAFDACALDYLIKPVQPARLKQVVDRILEKRTEHNAFNEQLKEMFHNYIGKNAYPHKIFVQTIGEMHAVQLDDVVYFSASGAYTNIHFNHGNGLLSSKPIKIYVESLEGHPSFVRVHRSFLVNKNHLKILHTDEGKYSITMSNNEKLEISQRRKEEIFKALTK